MFSKSFHRCELLFSAESNDSRFPLNLCLLPSLEYFSKLKVFIVTIYNYEYVSSLVFFLGFLRKAFASGDTEGAFNMSCIERVEALMILDPSSIPASNDSLFLMYGENDISTAFGFYGKPAEDDFEGHKSNSPPLLNCTLDSLKLE